MSLGDSNMKRLRDEKEPAKVKEVASQTARKTIKCDFLEAKRTERHQRQRESCQKLLIDQ